MNVSIPVLFIALLCITSLKAGETQDQQIIAAARGVLTRVMGSEAAARIELGTLPQIDGRDVYRYQSTADTLTIHGSSTVAICRGSYDYLRANNMGTVGWAGARLNIPAQWPTTPLTTVETPFKIRQSYNVVTFGYTTPYWTWHRWQQELDWQAMHGYNMVLAPVATEAIATRVWNKMGFTQKEIDAFYTSPAHLPWQRMGNIQSVGGTLPPEWHTDQIALQKKLLARMRELGIEPVIQGFAGFVPAAIKRIRPDAKIQSTYWTGGFGDHQHPAIVMPDDALFAKIMKSFLVEWKKEFGDVSHILVDSFNEMHLPKTADTDRLLRSYGRNTYQALTSVIPDATWVLQGWMFSYQRNIWNNETLGALVKDVPDDKLLILDYAHDYNPGWDYFSSFHGKSWALGYVPNMGGKTAHTGKMRFYASQAAKVLANSKKGKLVGITLSGEALENNEVLYELISDTAWSDQPIDLDQWLPSYVTNRYGKKSQPLQQAWSEMRHSVYSSFTDHPRFGWQTGSLGKGSAYHDAKYVSAMRQFLSAAPEMQDSQNYRDDALEMAALTLSIRAQDWFNVAQQAITLGDIEMSKQAADRACALLLQADRLLVSHPYLRLEDWIAFARSHGTTDQLSDYYEQSARQLVTIWGPPINDYSARVWSGLIRDFYVPRMKKILESQWEGKPFNRAAWEMAFVKTTGLSKVKPYKKPALAAHQLVSAAYAEALPSLEINDKNVIANWTPAQMSTEWQKVTFEIPAAKLKQIKGLRFLYTRGDHRLDIRSVSLFADGAVIATDKHFGTTGIHHKNNLYTFKLPEHIQANNSCHIEVDLRSNGGTDSTGKILLVK